MKISVVIQTYNSEQFLERVLNSVKEFDEIVVCDMYSTDRTIEIARKFDCKIVYHKKTDFCEPARNFAIHSATYDWVLVVDSDEIVPADLKDYLYTLLREQRAIGGVWIPRKNYLMGKFIHGDYPDYILRFFRKQNAFWPPYVHAVPRVEGKVIRVPRNKKELAFIHLVNNPLELKLNKLNIYTSKEIPKRTGQNASHLFVIVTSGNIACEEGQADTGIKKGLCIDYRNRCDHGDSLVQLLSGNPGVIGSDRNDHIFYISTVSDVYGAGRVQRKASGEERDQRSDSAGWRVYYGAGIFCGE